MFHVAICSQVQEEGERAFGELTREVTVIALTRGRERKRGEGSEIKIEGRLGRGGTTWKKRESEKRRKRESCMGRGGSTILCTSTKRGVNYIVHPHDMVQPQISCTKCSPSYFHFHHV